MNSYWDGTCTEWNEKGEITYQGKFRKNWFQIICWKSSPLSS
jgi:hypothetical protein